MLKKIKKLKVLPAVLALMFLAACAGGGGGGSTPSTDSSLAADSDIGWEVVPDDPALAALEPDDPSDLVVDETEYAAGLTGVKKYKCGSATRTIQSAANSEGKTQTCLAVLPKSKPSGTAVVATVSNGGRYSLICRRTGRWRNSAVIANAQLHL